MRDSNWRSPIYQATLLTTTNKPILSRGISWILKQRERLITRLNQVLANFFLQNLT